MGGVLKNTSEINGAFAAVFCRCGMSWTLRQDLKEGNVVAL